MEIGKLLKTELTTEMKRAYLDYAMSVIVERALPDVRDGLKPVHRRILYAMHELGLDHTSKYKKSATVVGEVLGKYHPHGDVPVYDAMVRLAQDFSMRYPLVDGQGNFGSLDGDPPAAMRYCVTGDTLAVTSLGLIRLQDIKHDGETTNTNVLSMHQETNNASKWFDSGIHPTITITTNQGFELTGTHNHPVLTWIKQEKTGKPIYKWKLLEEITTDDIVVLDRSKDTLWPIDELSLETFIPKNVHSRTVKKQLPKTLDGNLAFILGSLIAEGSVSDENKLEFCNGDNAWIDAFETSWKKVFPDTRLHRFAKQPSSYGKKSYFRLEIHSLYVIAFLRNLGLSKTKSAEKTVPFSILQSPKHVVSSFLRAYFEGDGSINSSNRMVELSCCSVSKKLVHELQILFLRFGILTTRRFDKYRNIHKLYLRGKKNYELFASQIGFFSERKKKKLQTVIDSLSKDSSLFDYVPFLRDYIYAILDKNLSYDNVRRFIYKHNFDRYGNLQLYAQNIQSSVVEELKPDTKALIAHLLSTNYAFDSVAKIEKTEPLRVYSLKVDSNCHSFVANGLINHNTEARMAPITSEMLWDLDKETVDTRPNFDSSRQEPVYLPAKLPNLLLMGAEGIAVGMATKIPPHNLTEILNAVVAMIDRTKITKEARPQAENTTGELEEVKPDKIHLTSDMSIDELLEYVKGPDFPTKGMIYDINEIKSLYTTGKGKIVIRGRAEIEEIGQGKSAIIITELPYQVNKALLVARIADLAKEKKVEGITDLRDESDRHGLRVVIELKRDASPKKVLNNLYKNTALQTTFAANVVALVNGTPQTLTLKVILEEYIKHRFIVITRRSEFELRQAKARLHILEGLKIAVDHIDEVIKTIRESKDQEEAKKNLIEKFSLSDIQAVAILDMQLRRLAALERQKIEDEILMIKETIAYLEDLLSHPEKLLSVIKEELLLLKEKYGDVRLTKVYKGKVDEFSEEDLIPNEPTVITLTTTGYIKRQSASSFQTQHRGGKGVKGMTTKDEDDIMAIRYAATHDNILFFTNKGKVYQLRAYEIAESSRTSKGTAIVNLLNIESEEKVQSFITYAGKIDNQFVFLTTRSGTVKKSAVSEFANIRRGGIVAIKLDKGDELVWSKITTGTNDIMLVTREGKAIRFSEKEARPMGRATQGVRGIKISANDEVIGMDVIAADDKAAELLTIMQNGLGKKTSATEFRGQSRGGMGVKVANVTEKTGKVVTAQIIPPGTNSIIMTSKKGQVVQLALTSIPRLSRATQGVILMRFSNPNDRIASSTCLTEKEIE